MRVLSRFPRVLPTLVLALGAAVLSGCGPDNLVSGVRSPFGYGLCGLIIVVLDILAIVEVLNSSRSSTDKLLWSLGIIVFPFVGLLVYYFVGRK